MDERKVPQENKSEFVYVNTFTDFSNPRGSDEHEQPCVWGTDTVVNNSVVHYELHKGFRLFRPLAQETNPDNVSRIVCVNIREGGDVPEHTTQSVDNTSLTECMVEDFHRPDVHMKWSEGGEVEMSL